MELNLEIRNPEEAFYLSGVNNAWLLYIESIYDTELLIKGDKIYCSSKDELMIRKLEILFSKMLYLIRKGVSFTQRDIIYIVKLLDEGCIDRADELYSNKNIITKTLQGKPIFPKTISQLEYMDSLKNHDIVFAIGPAGTGKTYLAVAYAVKCLKDQEIKKIILTRPAVEAGESLGYLPGDLKEKVDPYLRPLYDCLHDTLGVEQTETLIEKGIIEIAPLAYMRGRTLENAFIILDEAQNTSEKQMKMFLTRMGFYSKMVITGDVSQIDLPHGVSSGLLQAIKILRDVPGIKIQGFKNMDVVRNPLVQSILNCYDEFENKKNRG